MRLQLISDVHVEFDDDRGIHFVDSLDQDVADVLVVAGDLGDFVSFSVALSRICRQYDPKPVVFVNGNHEVYGASLFEVERELQDLQNRHTNLTVLDRSVEVIQGHRFVGATLWYQSKDFRWSDFRHIMDSPQTWIPQRGREDAEFFRKNLQPGDVAVSHMLPSWECVAPRWRGFETNHFFVNDLTKEIEAARPALFCFGHTHERMDLKIGETRLISNPRSYPHEQRETYQPNQMFEV